MFDGIARATPSWTIVFVFALPEAVPPSRRTVVLADVLSSTDGVPGALKVTRLGLMSAVVLSSHSVQEVAEWWKHSASRCAGVKLGADIVGDDGMASLARLELGAQEEARSNPEQDCFVVVDGRVVGTA